MKQLVEELLGGGDHTGTAAVLSRGQDQVDQVLADVGVGELDGTGRERADAVVAGVADDRRTGVDAFACRGCCRSARDRCYCEAGHTDLTQRPLGTVAEHAADEPAFGDRGAGERAWREAVLLRQIDDADIVAEAVGLHRDR